MMIVDAIRTGLSVFLLLTVVVPRQCHAAVKTIDWDDENQYSPMTASVGDTLSFSIAGKDDWIQLLPDMKAFQACDFKNAVAIYTKTLPQRPATPVLVPFSLTKAGDYFFASGSVSGVDDADGDPKAANMTQCKAKNFKLQVTVTGGGSTTGTATGSSSTAGTKSDSTAVPPSSSASSLILAPLTTLCAYLLTSLTTLLAANADY